MDKPERRKRIVETMVFLGKIPSFGAFKIDEDLLLCYMDLYNDITKKQGEYRTKSNMKLARRLAGLNLIVELSDRYVPFDSVDCGLVYLISNPIFEDHYKVGMTLNVEKRLSQYQTYDPLRRFQIVKYDFVLNRRETERRILLHPNSMREEGEWIRKENAIEVYKSIVDRNGVW